MQHKLPESKVSQNKIMESKTAILKRNGTGNIFIDKIRYVTLYF